MLTADFAIGEVGTVHFGIQSSLHRHIWFNIAVISLTAKSNVLLSLLVAANWSGVPLCPCKLTAWASGAGMGRLVSHWGSPGGWAVGRCRLSAGAPVVREMAVREMKGREMKFREMKFLHLSCLQPNYYQGMMLQKHDYNDMSKRIRKHELLIIIKWGEREMWHSYFSRYLWRINNIFMRNLGSLLRLQMWPLKKMRVAK